MEGPCPGRVTRRMWPTKIAGGIVELRAAVNQPGCSGPSARPVGRPRAACTAPWTCAYTYTYTHNNCVYTHVCIYAYMHLYTLR